MIIRGKGNLPYLILLSCIAALGGLLFGFDTAVISGAIGYIKPEFNLSPAMVGWVVFSEIFPTKIRGRAVSLVTAIVWGVCFLVSQTFPILLDRIGTAWIFLIFAIFCVLGFVFVFMTLPETKQKTLEEIEKSW